MRRRYLVIVIFSAHQEGAGPSVSLRASATDLGLLRKKAGIVDRAFRSGEISAEERREGLRDLSRPRGLFERLFSLL